MAYYWNKDGNIMDREIRRNESKAFFNNLRYLAEQNGLTNKELANVLDIHPSYISKYLSGNTVPREDAFESMKKHAMDFFDISAAKIIDGDFEEDHEEVIAEPVKVEEDRTQSDVLNMEMRTAIQQRRDKIAQLQKEIDALELAFTLMKADHIL